jgi:hypothetical protein
MGLPLIYRRSPLAFPGRAPGFDQSHPAAASISIGNGFSGIAVGSNIVSLLNDVPGTVTATVGSTLDGHIGPAFTTAASGYSSFANQLSVSNAQVTIGAIFVPSASQVGALFSTGGTNAASTRLYFGTSTITIGNVNNGSSFTYTFSVGTPYFVAASGNFSGSSGPNFTCVIVNLATGQTTTFTNTASISPTTSNGTYRVGESGNAGAFNGKIAAVMFALTFLSAAALKNWASRPWDFWYPPTVENLIFAGLSGARPVPVLKNKLREYLRR